MESVLKEKQRKGQHAQHGKEQGSRLTDKHLSHSHSSQSVLRSFNIPDAGFGKRVNFQLNSRNFVSQIFLVCDMAVSDGGGYCKNLGLSLLKSVDLRYSGRKFHECDVETENFIQMHKNKEPEKLAELLRICGGANFATTKKVVVPLINYFSPLHRQKFEKGPCWYNTQGSSRLEVELKFRAKDDVCAGSGSITSCEVYYEEVHVPLAVETSYRNRDKVRPRITYNSIKDITTSSGVRQEIDLSSIIAGGNVKCMWFRENLIADRTGSTRDDLKTSRPANVEVKINGTTLFEEDDLVLSMWRLLQGQHIDPNEDTPFIIPFCTSPDDNNSSGYLPSSQDSMSVFYTPSSTGKLDIFVEYEKMWRRTEQGRIEKSDS
jgi:hypothetical protein